MREILSDQGSLYLHIGHQMMPYLKVILDEVFGAKNCRNIITRRKCSSKNSTKNQYANLNDYILFYTKTNNYIWNPQGEKPSDEWIQKNIQKLIQRAIQISSNSCTW
jgi:adenine-specific DNA-methyltransferase